jgi:hypothetical protein
VTVEVIEEVVMEIPTEEVNEDPMEVVEATMIVETMVRAMAIAVVEEVVAEVMEKAMAIAVEAVIVAIPTLEAVPEEIRIVSHRQKNSVNPMLVR